MSPSSVLMRLAAQPPDAVAIAGVTGGTPELRYGELERASAEAAAGLRRAGVRPGGVVAMLLEPGPLFVTTLLGVWRAGGLAVPLCPQHAQPELAYAIANAGPSACVASRALAAPLAAASGRPSVPAEDLRGAPADGAAAVVDGADDGLMLFTSGTTGRPKGVRLSHRALAATVETLEGAWRWRRDDRLLHVLPLHHTHGLIVALLGALWSGASVRFAPFAAAEVWGLLADATVLMAVPTMYAKLMEAHREAPPTQQARWAEAARRLRLFTSGSAALPAPLLEAFRAATGQSILERYGMTEIGMALSNPYDGPRIAGAVGRELAGVTVDIVDEAGAAVGPGEPGELRVRTPQMFSGYHGDPDATRGSFDAEGRFRTGDTGARDAQGVVRILGRTSVDIIKSGGYKLSALEIEAALAEHPDVAEVAVIGAPDPTWGETVVACIVARPGARPTLDDLKVFARSRLAPYKLPRALRLLAALPRNPMGKVQKRALIAGLEGPGAT